MPYAKTEEGRRKRREQYERRRSIQKEQGLSSKGTPYITPEEREAVRANQKVKLKEWLTTEEGKKHLKNLSKKNRKYASDREAKDAINKRKAELRRTSLEHNLSTKLKYAKYRASKENLPFDIDLEYLLSIYTGFCPYLNIPLSLEGVAGNSMNTISIDKIIPKMGYVRGNIEIVSYKANVMKQDVDINTLRTFAKSVLKKFGE